MGKVHHADDAEHHRVADGNQAVDRAERNPVDELLDKDFHAPAAPSMGLPSLSRRRPLRWQNGLNEVLTGGRGSGNAAVGACHSRLVKSVGVVMLPRMEAST